MADPRNSKQIASDITALVNAGGAGTLDELPFTRGIAFPALTPRPQIGAATGIARISGASSGGASMTPPDEETASNGIASPLTETSRTLHSTQAVSSDGLFVWSVPESITMVDAEGRTVIFNYAAP